MRTIAGESEPQRPIQPLHDLWQRGQQFRAAFQPVHPADKDQMPQRFRGARSAYTQAIGPARLRSVTDLEHTCRRKPVPMVLGLHVAGVRDNRGIAPQKLEAIALLDELRHHRNRTEAATAFRVVLPEALPAEAPVTGLNDRSVNVFEPLMHVP